MVRKEGEIGKEECEEEDSQESQEKTCNKAKLKRSKLEEKMAEFGRQVAALEMKTRRVSADTRKEIEAAIKELQTKAGQVQEKLDQMKSAGAAGWGDIALGIDSAIDGTQRSLSQGGFSF